MKSKSLTEGPILKALITIAVPIIGANLLQTSYQLVDAFWVGRLGANAVAAVSISYPVNFLLISLCSGFGFAGNILVAQYAGAKNSKMVNHVAQQTVLMVFIIAVIMTGVAYWLSPYILHWLNVQDEIFADANFFQRIIFLGLIFNFGFIMFTSLLRGIGQVKIPLYINALTLGLNFILDPLFIYGWGPIPAFGVAGAAFSTLSTLGLSAVIGWYILFSGKTDFRLSFKGFRFDGPVLKKAFKVGMPSSIEITAKSLALTLLTGLASGFGTDALAAYGVVARLISFFVVICLGILFSTSTLVGQNIGANRIDRAERTADYAVAIAFVSMTVLGLIAFFFAEPIILTFLNAKGRSVELAVSFLQIVAPSFGFMGAQLALVGALRGSGNTVQSMLFTVFGLWVIQFPFAWIVSDLSSMQHLGIWWSFPVGYVVPALATYIWYKQGTWKRKRLIA